MRPSRHPVQYHSNTLYKMRADGTGPVNLTDDPAGDFTPDWQPLREQN
jgi:hypothetical protein